MAAGAALAAKRGKRSKRSLKGASRQMVRSMTEKQLREMGETFEDIEHRQFGKDGFDDALKQVAAVEETFGVADLAQFTAPAPPRPT